MHKLCLSLHDMKRVMSNQRTQPTSHRKVKRFHWIIHSWSLIPFPYSKNQIKLNSLHQCSPVWSIHLFLRELIYANHALFACFHVCCVGGSHLQVLYEIRIFKNTAKIKRKKHLCWSLFSTKLHSSRLHLHLKRDFGTSVFL